MLFLDGGKKTGETFRYKMEERQGSWRGEEEKTEDQLIRTSPVLRRSTPVGPGFKARSTPCLRVPLPMLLRFSRFRSFSAPFSSFSLLPHSFFGSLPFSSISRCSLSMRSYTHTHITRIHVHARAQRHCDPLRAFRPSSFLPASSPFLPRARNNVVVGHGDSSSVGDKRPIKGTVEPQHRRITTCSARSTKGRRDIG